MKLEEMTRQEKSLLLYFETRAVDYGGRVDTRMINADDIAIAKKWDKAKFIRFGRIVMKHHNSQGTNWCLLSKKAWDLAHQERKNRWERLWLKREWMPTEDSRVANGDPHFSGLNAGVDFAKGFGGEIAPRDRSTRGHGNSK